MDPLLAKTLVDTLATPDRPAPRRRPRSSRYQPAAAALRAIVIRSMRRWADHLERRAPQPATCSLG